MLENALVQSSDRPAALLTNADDGVSVQPPVRFTESMEGDVPADDSNTISVESRESVTSSESIKSDGSKGHSIDFKERSSHRMEEDVPADDSDTISIESRESVTSSESIKSDGSKGHSIDFKERSSHRDSSSFSVSIKSDKSEDPIDFSLKISGGDSSAFTVSFKSDRSDGPIIDCSFKVPQKRKSESSEGRIRKRQGKDDRQEFVVGGSAAKLTSSRYPPAVASAGVLTNILPAATHPNHLPRDE